MPGKILFCLFFVGSTIFAAPVFAGGGLVSFESNPELVKPGEQYIVRPMVYSDNYGGTPCRNCPISIKFEGSQSGDVINQSDSKTDENGTMYAKVISQSSGERIIYADVILPNGSSYQSSKYVLYYEYKAEPIGNLVLRVVGQKILGGDVRQVSLSWNSIPDAYYLVSVRPVNKSYGSAIAQTNDLNAAVTINISPDYYAKVSACNNYGRCIESAELLIPELKVQNTPIPTNKPSTTTKPTTNFKPTSAPSVQPSTTPGNDKQIEEFNKKVEDLQGQLEESKKRQSVLETRLSQIVGWIKSIFPFFK